MIPPLPASALILLLLQGASPPRESPRDRLARCRRELALLREISRGLQALPDLRIERAEFADLVYSHARLRRDLGVLVSQVRRARAEFARADSESDRFWFGRYEFHGGLYPTVLHAVLYRPYTLFRAPFTGKAWKEWKRIDRRWRNARRNLEEIQRRLGPEIRRKMQTAKAFALHPFPREEEGFTTLGGRRVRKADMDIHDCRRRLREIDARVRNLESWKERPDVLAIRWPGGERFRPGTIEEALAVKKAEIEEILEESRGGGLEGRYRARGVPPPFAKVWNALLSRISRDPRFRLAKNRLKVTPMTLTIFSRRGKRMARLSPWRITNGLIIVDREGRESGTALLALSLSFREAPVDEKGAVRFPVTMDVFMEGVADGRPYKMKLQNQVPPPWRAVPGDPPGRTYLLYGTPPIRTYRGKEILFYELRRTP